jgi:rubrerythrin
MDYSLNRLTKEQITELFDEIPEGVLRDFLTKGQKHFEKSKHIKGYRINKLPKAIIYKIFIDEIQSVPNTVLERNIIGFIKLNFKDTNIEAIVEAFSNDVFSTAFAIEKELISNGFTVSPAMILLITEHSITDGEKAIIDSYHKLYLETQDKTIKKTKAEIEEHSNKKYNTLLDEYNKTKNNLSIVRKEVSSLKSDLSSKEDKVKCGEQEVSALTARVKVAVIEIDELKKKFADYGEKVRIISEQAKEIKYLTTQTEELQYAISNLSSSILSPNCVIEMCAEILDDLKQESIGAEELIRQAKTLFSESESVLDAWLGLSDREKEKIENIVRLMNENTITNNDIDTLEDLESYIHIKYMIAKSLVVVFYKYLEQNTSQKKLAGQFRSYIG